MSAIRARLVRLERSSRPEALRDALAHCGVRMPVGMGDRATLAALDDTTLARVVEYLNTGVPQEERERRQAWLQSLTDEELEAFAAGKSGYRYPSCPT
jgi:hypothetical protein